MGSIIASYLVATVLVWMHASDLWELLGGVALVWLVLAAIFWASPHLLLGLIFIWLVCTVMLWMYQ